jgi:mannosyl-oligosaccharide alpha-1,2-mannosidase
MRFSRRQIIASTLAASTVPARSAPRQNWRALAEEVRSEFAWAWDHYVAQAWGQDEIKPLTGGASSFPMKTHHLGLSLIEALDTLWVMGLDSRFQAGVDWVKAKARWDVDGEVSVFETSIRLMGGLLSAHHACGDPALLASAHDLAERLLPAFQTPTGIPYGYINLKTGAVREPANSPAGAGTYLAEWGTLARLTGERRFFDIPKRAMGELYKRRSPLGLLGQRIDARTGAWLNPVATVGSYGDSFYETLWDAWDLFGDRDCLDMYRACTAAILAHQPDRLNGQLWFADVDMNTGARASTEQDELAAFYGGLLAQGGQIGDGAAYTESWAAVQDRFGVLPETYDYASGVAVAKTNALRPELADAALTLWLVTRDERWRAIGATHFRNMVRWNKARFGYADLADVTAVPKTQADHCPGYWWSEQTKYYWLLFSDTPRLDYRRAYLSTEGNVLRGFKRGVRA